MGMLSTLLTLPASGPIGAVGWLARQIADAAMQEILDPARIETALLLLERRLETGAIDEAAFEAEEARLLEELLEIRAIRAGTSKTDDDGDETEEDGADAADGMPDEAPALSEPVPVRPA